MRRKSAFPPSCTVFEMQKEPPKHMRALPRSKILEVCTPTGPRKLWVNGNAKNESDKAVAFINECLKGVSIITSVKKDVWAADFKFDEIREEDAVILMVEAGAKNGKKIERVLQQLGRQDIKLCGAFLYNEDEKLIKHYYR